MRVNQVFVKSAVGELFFLTLPHVWVKTEDTESDITFLSSL